MAKGLPVNISGTAYPREKRPRASKTRKRKRGPEPNQDGKYAKRRLSGYGDYSYKGWTPGADIGGFAGKYTKHIPFIGRYLNEGTGSAVGHAIGRIFGYGDYYTGGNQPNVNSIINPMGQGGSGVISGVPTVGGTVFSRREYLKDIISADVANKFTKDEFILNPARAKTFPWLAKISEHFEQYIIRGLVFEFVSLSADASSSVQTGLGYVVMGTQYDILDDPFESKSEIENYIYSQSTKPSVNQMHGVECDRRQTVLSELYVSNGEYSASSDKRLYDFGRFTIANSAPGVSVTLGELWISYDIELIKPKIPQQLGGSVPSFRYSSLQTGATASVGFGTTQVVEVGNMEYEFIGPNQLNFKNLDVSSTYLCVYSQHRITGAGGYSSVPTFTISNGNVLEVWKNSVNPPVFTTTISNANSASNEIVQSFIFKITFEAAVTEIQCTPGTTTVPQTYGVDFYITQIDNTLF